nr:hypothetical protein CFP56_70611 [Quercus suber]
MCSIYEKQKDAPEDAPAATPVQHSMPPSATANASVDADPAATISAAQIVHLKGEYEKQEDAPAATPVQHSMPPSAAASASGDADPAATISAAQIGTQCTTKTKNSRPNSSRSPDYFSELKKIKTCNYSSKR